MRKKKNIQRFLQKITAVFMIATLFWLTVSAPVVYRAQQRQAEKESAKSCSALGGNEEESAKPAGANEGKGNSTNSLSEEYLHELHLEDYFFSAKAGYHKPENASDYVAYHGELLVPPPNFS
jgi:hypothetical protein